MIGNAKLNWDRYNELVALRDSGRIEEAAAEFAKLAEVETDPEIKAFILLQLANGLRFLKRSSDARRKIREASSILGPKHNDYIRVVLAAAILDIDQENWKGALKKLDEIVEKYTPLLGGWRSLYFFFLSGKRENSAIATLYRDPRDEGALPFVGLAKGGPSSLRRSSPVGSILTTPCFPVA